VFDEQVQQASVNRTDCIYWLSDQQFSNENLSGQIQVKLHTDLLEKRRVSVYTKRFAEETSCQCLHKPICWRNVVSVSTQTQ
jgi:hypothetical protein